MFVVTCISILRIDFLSASQDSFYMQKPGYFHGDDDSLVDRLIEASEQSFKPKANPALTHLVGRQLQPFQFDDMLEQPVTPAPK